MGGGSANGAAGGRQGNHAARRLYEAIVRSRHATPFKVLPDPFLYTIYYAVIARPLCLADIDLRIDAPERYSLADLLRDLRRIVTNAKKYNVADSAVFLDAVQFEVRAGGCGGRRSACPRPGPRR
jgi:hypothetical protein